MYVALDLVLSYFWFSLEASMVHALGRVLGFLRRQSLALDLVPVRSGFDVFSGLVA
jgi:hypothetical protein